MREVYNSDQNCDKKQKIMFDFNLLNKVKIESKTEKKLEASLFKKAKTACLFPNMHIVGNVTVKN